MRETLYFSLGTEAELMKMFPVIKRAREAGFTCRLVATGQNDILKSPYLEWAGQPIDIDICPQFPAARNIPAYLRWLMQTGRNGIRILNKEFDAVGRDNSLMVVHGDTLTTALGSFIARRCHIPYVHVESGLRSFNYLSPFPEELDRLYGSLGANINFCPGEVYAAYAAQRFRGKAVNTIYNTGIETLYRALDENGGRPHAQQPKEKYFMFMMHRQENLLSASFLAETVKHIAALSQKMPCVFIYHQQTQVAMEKAGVFNLLTEHDNVLTLPRQLYVDFIKLVNGSEFVITDGCGNQQEMYYLGKPYLIMRTKVEENSEGLGHNAKVFGGDFGNVDRFINDYPQYTKKPIVPEILPSQTIVDELIAHFQGQGAVAMEETQEAG